MSELCESWRSSAAAVIRSKGESSLTAALPFFAYCLLPSQQIIVLIPQGALEQVNVAFLRIVGGFYKRYARSAIILIIVLGFTATSKLGTGQQVCRPVESASMLINVVFGARCAKCNLGKP